MSDPIRVNGKHQTLEFAASELSRYLSLATGKALTASKGPALFTLAVADASEQALPADFSPEDDWIIIRPQGKGYLLAGSNPRSVLFAVYRYLQELGIRWIRPGPKGEVVPKVASPIAEGVNILERASYKFRTICIEGACSLEHVRNLIDWAAKHGMNGYFIQFDYGTAFWRQWYTHAGNPHLRAEPFSPERAQEIVGEIVRELRLRDLRFERMGHGWTPAAIGLTGEGWDSQSIKLSDEQRQMLAEIGGSRDLFHGVPLNTNLCYSSPRVRRTMANIIVEYAERHSDVDHLHVWLADGSNNNCECPGCQAARPSDFFVQILNEVDAGLAARGLKTRIVFLIYVDLLWPPLKERLKNQDRFILMFAPITRSFQQSFADAHVPEEALPDYRRNRLEFPKDAGMNIKFLRAWQEHFKGEGFDFDYHNIWACHYDPTQYALAGVLHRDIQHLARIGLHGFNSCQVQRLSFPHNLLLDVLARTLWHKELPFEAISRRSFQNAYGNDGEQVEAFFREMSGLWAPFFNPVFIPQPDEARIEQGLENLTRMPALMDRLRPLVSRNLDHPVEAVRQSWKYLDKYLGLLALHIPAFEAYLRRSPECRSRFEKVSDYVWRNEEQLHEAFDAATFLKVQQWRVNEAEGRS
jgi:hypothetical protein